MDRIQTSNATPDNKFADASPEAAGTYLNAEWCNGIQEELVGLIEASGATPAAGTYNQLFKAIINLTYRVGDILETTNDALTPNQRYPWQTWEEYGKGRVTVGRDTEGEIDLSGQIDPEALTTTGNEFGSAFITLENEHIPRTNSTWDPYYTADPGSGWGHGGPVAQTVDEIGIARGPENSVVIMQPGVVVRRWRRTA